MLQNKNNSNYSVQSIEELIPNSKKNWYVFYTAPRAEKVVYKELCHQDFEVFLPITKTIRVWKNRQRKLIDQVLFPNYIFVNTEEKYLHRICQIPRVSTFIQCGGIPCKINLKCIEAIKGILDLQQEVSVEPDFNEGENVRIVYGPLAGYEGILTKHKSRTRFGIQLKEINQTVLIDICQTYLEKC